MRAQLSFILSQITRLTDRRTDRILIARPRLHSMQRGNEHEKMIMKFKSSKFSPVLNYNVGKIYTISNTNRR